MSFLALLFGLGGLAIAFPLLFHLIRPRPRGRQPFSSLMFLKTSPPRITKRSRLENLLLLLLRSAVIALLALAFMRPFLRQHVETHAMNLSARRIAVLVDVSASMRRGDLWQQARRELNDVLNSLESGDDVALFTFDDQIQTIVDFDSQTVLNVADRRNIVMKRFDELGPTWGGSRLGNGLIVVADSLNLVGDQLETETQSQVVLISDLQQSADLSALQAFSWPSNVRVDVRPVTIRNASNATARVVNDGVGDTTAKVRVRVTNANDSTAEQFFVKWEDDLDSDSPGTAFYVPPGQNRTLTIDRNAQTLESSRLVLAGDTATFDNSFFVVPVQQKTVNILYLGDDDADDAEGLLYFLKRGFVETGRRRFAFRQISGSETIDWPDNSVPELMVVAQTLSGPQVRAVEDYLSQSGTVLVVLRDTEMATSVQSLAGIKVLTEPSARPSVSQDYVMLADIDFQHPLFQPLSGPRYNDFTKIRFWHHVPIAVETGDDRVVVAKFDNREPAIWQRRIGPGLLLGFSSGWQPASSQLALSTKFVPIMSGLLKLSQRIVEIGESGLVNQPIRIPGDSQTRWILKKPDGTTVPIPVSDQQTEPIEAPGIYSVSNGEQDFQVAVNLPPSESLTAPMPVERLETFNVNLGSQTTQAQQAAAWKKIHDRELESRQKIWKWMLAAAVGVLIIETILASRPNTKSSQHEAIIT